MKKIEFNNIEENKLVMGYTHYRNKKGKIIHKKSIGYIIPKENLIFCLSSQNFLECEIEKIAYEKIEDSENLYCSFVDNKIFELKRYMYPKSNNKISIKELMETLPILEKYVLDENFESNTKVQREYNRGVNNIVKSKIKHLMLRNQVSNK